MSNLIPITRIYDIYPKYTYSNDVKKFMDEIVDIDRANVFTEADMVNILDKIRAEIEKVFCMSVVTNELRTPMEVKTEILQILDKYKAESEDKHISGKENK